MPKVGIAIIEKNNRVTSKKSEKSECGNQNSESSVRSNQNSERSVRSNQKSISLETLKKIIKVMIKMMISVDTS